MKMGLKNLLGLVVLGPSRGVGNERFVPCLK